jgi:integrase
MPKVELTAAFVRDAQCRPGAAKTDFYDTASVTGFVLECRKSGGKTYYLRYSDSHGKLKQIKIGSIQDLSFDQAKRQAKKLRSQVTLGDDPLAQKQDLKSIPSFQQFIDERYLPYIKGYKRSWHCDVSLLNNHLLPRWGKKHLDQIDQRDVIAFFHHLRHDKGLAPGTCNRVLVLTRYLFNCMLKWKIAGVSENPAAGIKPFADAHRERFLTPEETQRLIQALEESQNPQLKYIVALLLLTGMRKRELLDSRWQDLDREHRLWKIPLTKTGKPRHIPLTDGVLRVLELLPRFQDCPYIIPNPETRKPYVSLYHTWHRARVKAGLAEVRTHDLRHSFASNLINSAQSLYTAGKLLGHTQASTTQRYAHLSQETLMSASELAAQASGLRLEHWG